MSGGLFLKWYFPVPWHSQRDNVLYPSGTCNTTSLAMAMDYYGISVPGNYDQTEDNLTRWMLYNGYDRHAPWDMAIAAKRFGMGDRFTAGAEWGKIKEHLQGNNPVIVHGWFTPSGHIVLLHGFNEEEGVWVVNDPAGKWPYGYMAMADGSMGRASGKDVRYSGDFMRKKVGEDGDLWAHFLYHEG